ncbi:MAG: RHS repeat-associated core domain-containing protein [bacterium]|nr:RHS repeat-associated core domain-containing protein [bacterium]MCP4965702.1 RHS repeat-associated core domain-containing protein [bacterium]
MGYTGQRLDASTGLMFYNARYYDPTISRFISADTIIPNPADPQDLNGYAYVGNNPINSVDLSGRADLRPRIADKGDCAGCKPTSAESPLHRTDSMAANPSSTAPGCRHDMEPTGRQPQRCGKTPAIPHIINQAPRRAGSWLPSVFPAGRAQSRDAAVAGLIAVLNSRKTLRAGTLAVAEKMLILWWSWLMKIVVGGGLE